MTVASSGMISSVPRTRAPMSTLSGRLSAPSGRPTTFAVLCAFASSASAVPRRRECTASTSPRRMCVSSALMVACCGDTAMSMERSTRST